MPKIQTRICLNLSKLNLTIFRGGNGVIFAEIKNGYLPVEISANSVEYLGAVLVLFPLGGVKLQHRFIHQILPTLKKMDVDETKFKKWFWTNIVEIRNKSYREEFDLIAFEKLFQPFVEFQPNELGAAVRWAMLVLGRLDLTPWPGLRRRPTVGLAHSAGVALVDTGAIVVDMSVQFHVPRHLEQTYIPSLK